MVPTPPSASSPKSFPYPGYNHPTEPERRTCSPPSPNLPSPTAAKPSPSPSAGIADLLQIILLPTFGLGYVIDDVIDVITALLLTAVCGFKWQFVFAFFMELIPGLDILPTWSAVALLIPSAPNDLQATHTQNIPQNPLPSTPIEVTAIAVPPIQSTPKSSPTPPPFPAKSP